MAGSLAHQPDVSKHLVSSFVDSLGHRFSNPELLQRALTHASLSGSNYERLEFLGDRVLGLVIAEWLTELNSDSSEGDMAKILSALVGRESLAIVAQNIGLGEAIRMSEAEASMNGRVNGSTLADCCEAVIGALYLDGGLEAARQFIRRQWQELMQSPPTAADAKTALQEWSQAKGFGLPEYDLLDRSGPDHAPQFTVQVTVRNYASEMATGASKRLAERDAAAAMLKKIKP